ncbi:MAG: hypothetical protein IJV59_00295 [Eubacterium sp.]|nr:hypothetical protein [Eubacterium sp.]
MVKATIISPVRTPKGRLKGYHLDIAGADHFLLCEEIKERIASRTLSVSGMKVNSAGALILEAPSKEKPVIYDPLIIHSALELSKKVIVSERVKNSEKPVAFIKRRIRQH